METQRLHYPLCTFLLDVSNCPFYNRWENICIRFMFLYIFFSQLIGKLKEKCSSLPSSHQKALSADADEIMYTTPGDVGIYYDDNGKHLLSFTPRKHLKSRSLWWLLAHCLSSFSHTTPNGYFLTMKQWFVCLLFYTVCFSGRKFVSILMRFWYLTSARLPEDGLEGTRVFQVAIGGEEETETKRLLTANYESVQIPFQSSCT